MTTLNKTKNKGELSRLKLIETAIALTASKGLERATARNIAAKAKVSLGLVNHHLGSQDQLVETMIKYISEKAYEQIESAPEDMLPIEKIIFNFMNNLDFFEKNPAYLKMFIYYYAWCTHSPKLKAINSNLNDRATERLRSYLLEMDFTESEAKHFSRILHAHLVGSLLKTVTSESLGGFADLRISAEAEIRALLKTK
jgi:AcrR family transcriptional regulator